MDRHYLTIWIAGVMIGTGSGLVVARSVTDPPEHLTNAKKEAPSDLAHTRMQRKPIDEKKFVVTPFTKSMKTSQEQKKNDPVAIAPEKSLEKVVEPRRINPESASPLPREEKKEVNQPSSEKTIKEKEPTLSSPEFRKKLQEIAPEFSEKTLKELEAIRSIIEMGETELPEETASKTKQSEPQKPKK